MQLICFHGWVHWSSGSKINSCMSSGNSLGTGKNAIAQEVLIFTCIDGEAEILKKMDKQKGFTLIELMVTIVITAIVTGIALSAYFSLKPKLRVSGAARQIQGDLMWARMQAVKQNNRFRIIFLNNHQYQILDDDDNSGTETAGEWIATKDIQANYGDVTFNPVPSQNPIFDPMGRLYWPIGITMSLQNSYGTKTVSVASTGRVKID